MGTATNVLVGVATLSFKYPLGGAYVEVGYTEDGVTIEYSADTADIEVEEETFALDRVITKEDMTITCNMAESSLANIDKAIAGSALVASTITIGPAGPPVGVIKEMSVKIVGNPPGALTTRTIEIPRVTAVGAVGMSYRKGLKTIVPVSFKALKPAAGAVCTIVDA